MGAMSLWHWLLVILVVMLLFGGTRLSSVMGDFAKGIKSFKKGLADDDTQAAAPTGTVNADPAKLTPPQAPAQPAATTQDTRAQ